MQITHWWSSSRNETNHISVITFNVIVLPPFNSARLMILYLALVWLNDMPSFDTNTQVWPLHCYTQSAMHTHEPQIPIVPLQLEDDGRSYRQTASQSHRSEIKSMEMIVSITSEPQQGWDNKFTLYRLPSERYRLYLLLLNSARCRKNGTMPASSGWAVRMFWQGRRAALGLVAMLTCHFSPVDCFL